MYFKEEDREIYSGSWICVVTGLIKSVRLGKIKRKLPEAWQ